MSYLTRSIYFVLILCAGPGIAAHELTDHRATTAETQKALQNNKQWHQKRSLHASSNQFKPVEDTADFAYVLMSSYEMISEVAKLRQTIASNLPDNVKLVILTDTSIAEQVRTKYRQWIPADRLIIATDSHTRNGFWARDSFPVPVYTGDKNNVSLVAANYFRYFDAWKAIADSVNASMVKMNFTFVGGNLLADEDGNCFTVDSSRLFNLDADDLRYAYGCNEVHILPYLKGIGDVDEVIKPLPGKRILTNVIDYKADLESWGYEVIMLHALDDEYRTYANTLIVKDTVFMPVYHVAEDAQAQAVYESLGYKVIPIKSITLSDDYNGSVHCQTMAYPAINLTALFKMLGVTEVH